MRFAVNYSQALLQLIDEGLVCVDLIKCPDWEGMLTEAKPYGPITIHFDHKVGLGNSFKLDFNRIQKLQEKTFTPHINTHLVTPKTLDPNNKDEITKINHLWREEISFMKAHLRDTHIALEHYPYTENKPHLRPAVDVKSFSDVIKDTGCMFLLDLAHARITAHTLKMDVKDYITALPLERLVEIHTTGTQMLSGVLTDHFKLQEEDFQLLEWSLDNIQKGYWRKPEIIAFEYGGVGGTFAWRTEPRVIETQVPILYEKIKQVAGKV
jgi:uncharacterized protein (UPF0276 family)